MEILRFNPANYHQFDHGYALTAHRSQGKTVDGVILSADAMKQELFYVGASRGRSEIAIVTSDLSNCANRWAYLPLARQPRSWRVSSLIYPSPSTSFNTPQLKALKRPLRTTKSASDTILG